MKLMCIKELRNQSELMLELGKVYNSDTFCIGGVYNDGWVYTLPDVAEDHFLIKSENGCVMRISRDYVITLESYRDIKLKELGI